MVEEQKRIRDRQKRRGACNKQEWGGEKNEERGER